jgi:hypothetical protein
MSTIIEIAAIRPPKEGKKVATVVAGDGRSFEIWPEKAAPLKIGERYDIEIETREAGRRSIGCWKPRDSNTVGSLPS